jgi:hypothetical protein
MNYAVNNDGDYYPRLDASFTAANTSLAKVNDGNYWYAKDPPNRWTTAGSPNAADWLSIDFGTSRRIDAVKLYFLDDGEQVVAPANYQLEFSDGSEWKPIPDQTPTPARPVGHRPNVVTFPPTNMRNLRAVFTHEPNGKTGLTELEAWGDGARPYVPAPPPAGNLAFNPKSEGFPKASASFSDQYGGSPDKAIDGKIIFLPTPMNRWTSYGSPNATDWLQVDFGMEKEIGRVELYIYDDHGGVQAPEKYVVQTWSGGEWRNVENAMTKPAIPTGGMDNTISFKPVSTTKFRVMFTNKGNARSGVTEIEAWRR